MINWFKRNTAFHHIEHIDNTLQSLHTDGVNLTIDELLYYQAKSSLINLKASKNQQSRMSGNYLARSKGRGMEFDEVRHYQTGDDIRTIDWRVTARTGKTHTKIFREEVERPVLVATDFSTSMLFGSQLLCKSIQAAHLAALVAWHAKERGDRLGGIVFNQYQHIESKPRSRKQGVLQYLHHLVELHRQSLVQHAAAERPSAQSVEYAFEQNCQRIRQLAHPGSLVYLITDGHAITSESVRHLSRVSQHCELIVCQIYDPIEKRLPQVNQRQTVAMTDGQLRQQITLGDHNTNEQYQTQVSALMNTKEQHFINAGARLLSLSAGDTIEQQLTSGVSGWIR